MVTTCSQETEDRTGTHSHQPSSHPVNNRQKAETVEELGNNFISIGTAKLHVEPKEICSQPQQEAQYSTPGPKRSPLKPHSPAIMFPNRCRQVIARKEWVFHAMQAVFSAGHNYKWGWQAKPSHSINSMNIVHVQPQNLAAGAQIATFRGNFSAIVNRV